MPTKTNSWTRAVRRSWPCPLAPKRGYCTCAGSLCKRRFFWEVTRCGQTLSQFLTLCLTLCLILPLTGEAG